MRPFFLLKPVKLKLEGQAYHRIWTQSGNHRPKTSHCLHYQPKTHFQTFIEPSFPYKNQAQTLGRAPKIWTVTHLSPVSCRNCLAGRLFSPCPQQTSFTHSSVHLMQIFWKPIMSLDICAYSAPFRLEPSSTILNKSFPLFPNYSGPPAIRASWSDRFY